MASRAYNTLFVLSTITFFISTTSSSANGGGYGFTVDLIHRDSPKSPLYNNQTMPFQHIHDAISRSLSRANHFFPQSHNQYSLNDDFDAQLLPARGEYVVSYSVGTPPFEIFGIVDTGSDLIWTQCKACDECYSQTAPMFDPKNSGTFKNIPCNSQLCTALVGKPTCDASNVCHYNARYADTSFSNGDLATDLFTLGTTGGRQVAFSQVVFGCGLKNKGTFNEKTSGVVGLGGGQISLVSQIDFSIGGKFSYCLVPISAVDKSSKMSFGQNAVVSGPGTVSTPLVAGKNPNFYYLTLEGISVGDKRFEFPSGGGGATEGNIIIDSGTTLTLLPPAFYSALESEVATQMMNLNLERVKVPQSVINLCFRMPSSGNTFQVPAITVHFKGADLKLNSFNAFLQVSSDAFCFAFKAYPSGSIYGNLAQMNFMVGYDRRMKTVSFKPVDCTTI